MWKSVEIRWGCLNSASTGCVEKRSTLSTGWIYSKSFPHMEPTYPQLSVDKKEKKSQLIPGAIGNKLA